MIKLYQGDCLEVMDKLIEQGVKVDAIITDPPYLIQYKTNRRKNKNHEFCSQIKNDKEFNYEYLFNKFNLILKDNCPIYIFGSWKTEPYFRERLERHFKHKNNIIWVKNNWTAGDLKAQYGQQYELIMLYNKGRSKFKEKRYSDVWNFNKIVGNKQLHQNQKPVSVIERIVSNSTNENDLILDCFMGSGTTGVACKKLNRNFIGIELDEKYYNIAKERIDDI